MLICITPYLDFSFPPFQEIYIPRTCFPRMNEWACSCTVNGEDLTHPGVPYYSHSRPLSATRTKARIAATCFSDIAAEYGGVC